MALLVYVPVSLSGMLCSGTAWDEHNATSFFHPMNKFVAVIALICQNQFALQVKWFQQCLGNADVIEVPTGK